MVYDVSGTLPDLSGLEPHFARRFGHPSVREEWFHLPEWLWMVTLITDANEPCAELDRAAFLARPGKVLNPLGPVPDGQAFNLPGLSRKVCRQQRITNK